jgi:hypothetical protein
MIILDTMDLKALRDHLPRSRHTRWRKRYRCVQAHMPSVTVHTSMYAEPRYTDGQKYLVRFVRFAYERMKEDHTMQHMHSVLRTFSILALLAIVALTLPLPAHARVHVSIGIGVPVYPAPVVVAPAPVVVYPAPVVVAPPPVVYYGSSPVWVGGSYGHRHHHWRHHHHRWRRW